MESNTKRDTVAQEIMDTLGRLACMAEKTAHVATEQLRPICNDDAQSPEITCNTAPLRSYPPLFNDMRDDMRTIEHALHRINEVLERCEV